ncbi:MAG: bifunctional precorrin-2 dehydrogenase/sirohydrochlorin ferrochelatase, partial [Nitrospinota bacterium]
MRKFFPVFIDLANKRCLVVGGGKVAERKVKELLRHGADVTVVSPELTSKLQKLRREKKFPYVSSNFKEADILGFFLVVDATGSSEVHKEISLFAGRNNILVNIVSAPHFSDFFTPAIFSRGDLKIAVST